MAGDSEVGDEVNHRSDIISWLILVVGVAVILAAAAVLAHAETCRKQDWTCNGTQWVLKLNGRALIRENMTAEECEAKLKEFSVAVPACILKCEEEKVYRLDS